MRKRMAIFLLTCSCLFGFAAGHAASQESSAQDEKTWEVNVYVDRMFKSGFADRVIAMFGEDAAELNSLIDRYQSVVGLNAKSDVQRLRVISTAGMMEFASAGEVEALMPKTVLIADLKTTGNLEGLILAAPGYASLESGQGNSLHAIELEGMRATIAFVNSSENLHYLVVSFDEALARKTVETLSNSRQLADDPESKQLANLHFSRGAIAGFTQGMPEMGEDEYPAAAIQRVLSKLNAINASLGSAAGSDSPLDLTLKLEATDEAAARQIEQLAKAGVGVIQMFIEQAESSDLDAMKIKSLVDGLGFNTDGNTVTIVAPIRDITTLMTILGEL